MSNPKILPPQSKTLDWLEPQFVQRTVLWSILGPTALFALLFGIGSLLMNQFSQSAPSIAVVGSALFFSSFVAGLATVHAYALFGFIGLIFFSFVAVGRRLQTLLVCIAAIAASIPFLLGLYFNIQLI